MSQCLLRDCAERLEECSDSDFEELPYPKSLEANPGRRYRKGSPDSPPRGALKTEGNSSALDGNKQLATSRIADTPNLNDS